MKKLNRADLKKFVIATSIAFAILLLIALCLHNSTGGSNQATISTDPNASNAVQSPDKEIRLPDLLDTAKAIKNNLMSGLKYLKQNKLERASQKLNTVLTDITAVQKYFDQRPFF